MGYTSDNQKLIIAFIYEEISKSKTGTGSPLTPLKQAKIIRFTYRLLSQTRFLPSKMSKYGLY